eukprot:s1778_g2.t1
MTLLRGARLSVVFFLLHSACFAAHVSALVVLFTFGFWKADGLNSWILLAASLLVLQLLISSVCCLATWEEFSARPGTPRWSLVVVSIPYAAHQWHCFQAAACNVCCGKLLSHRSAISQGIRDDLKRTPIRDDLDL